MFYISQLNKWILYSDILGVKEKHPSCPGCLVEIGAILRLEHVRQLRKLLRILLNYMLSVNFVGATHFSTILYGSMNLRRDFHIRKLMISYKLQKR